MGYKWAKEKMKKTALLIVIAAMFAACNITPLIEALEDASESVEVVEAPAEEVAE